MGTIAAAMKPYREEIDREFEARDMIRNDLVFEGLMHLFNEGLVSNAFVECQTHADALSDAEKGVVIAKFVEADMLDEARRLRYRWKMADRLPIALSRALSTRPRRKYS